MIMSDNITLAIKLTPAQFTAIDKLAKREKTSRSEVARLAMADFAKANGVKFPEVQFTTGPTPKKVYPR